MRPADKAWAALGLGILIYDLFAPRGETLSEACDRYRVKHPVITHLVLIAVSAHLARIVPPRYDALHGFDVVKVRWQDRRTDVAR